MIFLSLGGGNWLFRQQIFDSWGVESRNVTQIVRGTSKVGFRLDNSSTWMGDRFT